MNIIEFISKNRKFILPVFIGIGALRVFGQKYLKQLSKPNIKFEKDIVYIFELPKTKGDRVPSLSPFVLKVITFMELYRIPYQRVFTRDMGPRNKVPYIYYNGEYVYDSTFIIEFLSAKFLDMPLDDHNGDNVLVSRDLVLRRFVEEAFNPVMLYPRWYDEKYSKKFIDSLGIPWFLTLVKNRFVKGVRKSLYVQGIGRYPADQVYQIGFKDIDALSHLLSSNDYLLGNEISLCDISVFSVLSHLYFSDIEGDSPLALHLKSKLNLGEYLERIKHKAFGDQQWLELSTRKKKGLETTKGN